MFRGRHTHNIDAKGRVSIPTGYRQELQQVAERPPILTAHDDHLRLVPSEIWSDYEERILSAAEVDPDAAAYVRMVIANAVEAPIDKQGRILVPQYLREMVGLQKEVEFAGVGPHVEIWDAARFRMQLGQVQSNFPEIARKFGAMLPPRQKV